MYDNSRMQCHFAEQYLLGQTQKPKTICLAGCMLFLYAFGKFLTSANLQNFQSGLDSQRRPPIAVNSQTDCHKLNLSSYRQNPCVYASHSVEAAFRRYAARKVVIPRARKSFSKSVSTALSSADISTG